MILLSRANLQRFNPKCENINPINGINIFNYKNFTPIFTNAYPKTKSIDPMPEINYSDG
jgi:hypothetical protein